MIFAKVKDTFLEKLHYKIFGQSMGTEMKKFVGSLGVTAFSTVITGIILLALNIISGRFMGPVEYGKYQLAYSVSSILIIFILVGVNISVGRSSFLDSTEKKKIIGTTFWFAFVNVLIISSLVYFFGGFAKFFKIPQEVLIISLIFSISLAFYNLIKSFYQAENKFKLIATLEILNYIAVAFIFGFFLISGKKSFEYILYSLIGGYSVFIIWGMKEIFRSAFYFSLETLKNLMK